MNTIDDIVKEMRAGFKRLETGQTNLGARMASLETKVSGMEGQLKANCTKLDQMKKDIEALRGSS